MLLSDCKPQLARFLGLPFAQVVQSKSEQPDALGQRVQGREQRLAAPVDYGY